LRPCFDIKRRIVSRWFIEQAGYHSAAVRLLTGPPDPPCPPEPRHQAFYGPGVHGADPAGIARNGPFPFRVSVSQADQKPPMHTSAVLLWSASALLQVSRPAARPGLPFFSAALLAKSRFSTSPARRDRAQLG
jgi:hypothetical protein